MSDMKKSITCLLVICLILAVFCLLSTGCSASPEDTIVGCWTWSIAEDTPLLTVQFYSDGTVDMDGFYTANYSIEGDTLRIETSGISLNYKCTFSDDGNKMYWTDNNDPSFEEVIFVRDK